ncbi:MAG: nitroreductase family deazaflavin-dependent oxidoreductase [Thermomicrobiales bacterium]
MPLPDRLARINRYVTNPLMRLFAGWLPPFAVVVHRGRSSGRGYRTPVMAFPSGSDVVIALTYGADRDWVKNVRVANGCVLIRGGISMPLGSPDLFEGDAGLRLMPRPVRLILRLVDVDQFLRLTPGPRADK